MNPSRGEAGSFGPQLRAFRKRAGLSQQALAERANMSAAAIASLEQGQRRAPYRQTVDALVLALGLSPVERDLFVREARSTGRRPRADGVAPEHNLPVVLTSFIERGDLGEILTLLQRHRLVTVTGPGGIGKTRTVVEIAHRSLGERRHPIWFVDLSSMRDRRELLNELFATLRASAINSDREADGLASSIGSRAFTVILDNCEHLVADVANVALALLRGCPNVSIVATSREPLGLASEVLYRLSPMGTPAPSAEPAAADARAFSAVDLFLTRYEAAGAPAPARRTALVVEICRGLDGVPLAIELAAAQAVTIGLDELRSRLYDDVLPGGPDRPARQRTLAATIDWSLRLLAPNELLLFERLSTFAGGFTLEAAETTCSAHGIDASAVAATLASLVAKSLVSVTDENATTRFSLLESIRYFSGLRLAASGDAERVARRHALWLSGVAERMFATGVQPERDRAEIENARAAIRWGLESSDPDDRVLAARIVGGMTELCYIMGFELDLERWTTAALLRIDEDREPGLTVRLLSVQIELAHGVQVLAIIRRAIAIMERSGETGDLFRMRTRLAFELSRQGYTDESVRELGAIETTLPPEEQTSKEYDMYLFAKCAILVDTRSFDDVRLTLDRFRRQLVASGRDPERHLIYLTLLAEVEFGTGHAREAIAIATRMVNETAGGPGGIRLCTLLGNLACYWLSLDDVERADGAARRALAIYASTQHHASLEAIYTVQHLAAIAALRGYAVVAAKLLGFVDAVLARKLRRRVYTDQCSYEIGLRAVEARLDAAELRVLVAAGSAMAMDEALRELQAIPPLVSGRDGVPADLAGS